MNLMIPTWEAVLQMLIPMCTTICIAGAILLLFHTEGSRSRKLLAYVMLAWGAVYAIRVFGILTGFMNFMKNDILAPSILIFGNLYAISMLWYPLEIVRPGWLNLKRCFLIMLPYLLVVGVYYTALFLLGETPVRLGNMGDFIANIGQFNVWYRLVIILSVIAYITYQLRLIYRYELSYQQWCDANYASADGMEISWLRYYGLGLILILFAFFWILLDGNTYCYVVHNVIVQLFFCFIFYKGFFHENPYTEGFFRNTTNEEKAREEAEAEEEPLPLVIHSEIQKEKPMDDTLFHTQLPAYKAKIETWMEETKPYLRKDFKLMDVAAVLPLNRTYLSQIFNEGWGTSFSSVVRDYRIRDAEKLLLGHPEFTVNQIALLCGFTSASVLHRTFVQCHGMTPKQYRAKEK